MKELINDGKLYSPILLMWICKEALVAQDQDMQPFHDPVTLYVDFSRSRGPLIRLFDRFCEANFELAKEANPDGCLAWDQIKTLSQKEELSCFGFKKMSSNSKDFRRAILGKNINNDSEDYVLVRSEIASEVTEQVTAGEIVHQIPVPQASIAPSPRAPKHSFLEHDWDRAGISSAKRRRYNENKPNKGIHLISFDGPDSLLQ
ncbi:hypothetical protein TUN199_11119 [Pyrenophora tritici-repentis]|nr:hypothetical protein Alg215_11100 [Pyrenophora tritici-repentis]KAI0616892.1 hypothetical protein TUN199_11119 [Pyrenophora tritici-repentis]KAI1561143.1 hypothetical protein PtrEW4_010794 [Pyrenophora tritici-repentis]KAI1594489.1 hypothetical protein PtrCC142_010904 [Pyrenophora tritici-repentis]PWO20465.1 AsnB, Asparagine synthase (glutamine-hydrolyzing) [Pyrenophora tritici-repentis]